MAVIEINRNVGTQYFNWLKSQVTALTKAGYTVYLDTHLNMVVGEDKKALHQKFKPKSPLVLVNLANLPQSIEEIEQLFMTAPIYPSTEKEAKGQDIANIMNSALSVMDSSEEAEPETANQAAVSDEAKPAKKTTRKKAEK